MLRFRWFGQACFEIEDSVTLVTDPHDGDSVGLNPPDTKGDIVTISHGHYDHASGKDLVSNKDSVIIQGEADKTAKGVKVKSFHSFHDKSEGQARGENTIYRFEMDGFGICHLGDLGHMLSDEKIQRIKPIDVLLIPVGGKFTIDGREAADITRKLDPQVVIPMHYKVQGLKVPISGAEQFLGQMEGERKLEEMETLELEELPAEKKVVKLKCLA